MGSGIQGSFPKLARRNTLLYLALPVVLAALLSAVAIPAPFTVDDCNYYSTVRALSAGGLSVPDTETLLPSRELLSFDPRKASRAIEGPPIYPVVPPLYAPFGLVFLTLGGWRGAIFLNALCVSVAAALVYLYAKKVSGTIQTGLVALAFFLLGTPVLGYTQGLWPHGLSLLLTFGAYLLVRSSCESNSLKTCAWAGFLSALACGVRYPNALLLLSCLLVLVLFHRRKTAALSVFTSAAALPLGASSLINHVRIGSYNPISKGPTYLKIPGKGDSVDHIHGFLEAFYSRVVDYSAHPPFSGTAGFLLPKDPFNGTFVVLRGMKKAWLQSSPWVAVVAIALGAAWFYWVLLRSSRTTQQAVPAFLRSARVGQELRALSIPIGLMVCGLCSLGPYRHDGWSFNQRYFIDLLPLCSVVFALTLGRLESKARWWIFGAAVGIGLALIPVTQEPRDDLKAWGLMYFPLILGFLLVAAWGLVRIVGRRTLEVLAAATLGWSLTVHSLDDMRAERGRREIGLSFSAHVAAALPEHPSALLLGRGMRDPMCRLHQERDVILVDPWVDQGKDAPILLQQLKDQGREIYAVGSLPDSIEAALGTQLTPHQPPPESSLIADLAPVRKLAQ